jgi:hypothetical protein
MKTNDDTAIPPLRTELLSGSATAKRALAILVEKGSGFIIPSSAQRKNLVVAFAKNDMIIYGKAFDCVRLNGEANLDSIENIESHLDLITIIEIKSTRKQVPIDFAGHFFSLSSAEMLVAQSLRDRFKFAFVNINTGSHLELSIAEIFARARSIYPGWSILF